MNTGMTLFAEIIHFLPWQRFHFAERNRAVPEK